MSVLKKKRSGGRHKLNQYNRYENDSKCAFSGFVPEGDLFEQSGRTAASRKDNAVTETAARVRNKNLGLCLVI